MHYAQERMFQWVKRATCREWAPIHLVRYRPRHVTLLGPYSTNGKNMVKNTASVIFTSLCTRGQDGLLGDPTVSKVTQYSQITKFPWKLVQRPECALMSLEHFTLSCSTVVSHEYTWGKENTRQKEEGLLSDRTVIELCTKNQVFLTQNSNCWEYEQLSLM